MTARNETVVEVLDGASFRGSVEVDQDVAAEDEVKAFHEEHLRLVLKVEAVEFDVGARLRFDAIERAFVREILGTHVSVEIANSVFGVKTFLTFGNGILVEVGSGDFQLPAGKLLGELF